MCVHLCIVYITAMQAFVTTSHHIQLCLDESTNIKIIISAMLASTSGNLPTIEHVLRKCSRLTHPARKA